MGSYEDVILNNQESEADECLTCEFFGTDKCRNQCMETQNTYNPNLRR